MTTPLDDTSAANLAPLKGAKSMANSLASPKSSQDRVIEARHRNRGTELQKQRKNDNDDDDHPSPPPPKPRRAASVGANTARSSASLRRASSVGADRGDAASPHVDGASRPHTSEQQQQQNNNNSLGFLEDEEERILMDEVLINAKSQDDGGQSMDVCLNQQGQIDITLGQESMGQMNEGLGGESSEHLPRDGEKKNDEEAMRAQQEEARRVEQQEQEETAAYFKRQEEKKKQAEAEQQKQNEEKARQLMEQQTRHEQQQADAAAEAAKKASGPAAPANTAEPMMMVPQQPQHESKKKVTYLAAAAPGDSKSATATTTRPKQQHQQQMVRDAIGSSDTQMKDITKKATTTAPAAMLHKSIAAIAPELVGKQILNINSNSNTSVAEASSHLQGGGVCQLILAHHIEAKAYSGHVRELMHYAALLGVAAKSICVHHTGGNPLLPCFYFIGHREQQDRPRNSDLVQQVEVRVVQAKKNNVASDAIMGCFASLTPEEDNSNIVVEASGTTADLKLAADAGIFGKRSLMSIHTDKRNKAYGVADCALTKKQYQDGPAALHEEQQQVYQQELQTMSSDAAPIRKTPISVMPTMRITQKKFEQSVAVVKCKPATPMAAKMALMDTLMKAGYWSLYFRGLVVISKDQRHEGKVQQKMTWYDIEKINTIGVVARVFADVPPAGRRMTLAFEKDTERNNNNSNGEGSTDEAGKKSKTTATITISVVHSEKSDAPGTAQPTTVRQAKMAMLEIAKETIEKWKESEKNKEHEDGASEKQHIINEKKTLESQIVNTNNESSVFNTHTFSLPIQLAEAIPKGSQPLGTLPFYLFIAGKDDDQVDSGPQGSALTLL